MKKFFKIVFFLLLIALAVFLIFVGIYFSKLSRKQYPFEVMIDQVFEQVEDTFSLDSKYFLGDNFQLDGTLEMKFSSEDYQNKSRVDSSYLAKNNELKNLSSMSTKYHFAQSKKDGRVLATIDEKIGEEEILSGKYLIDNSSLYYFVNGVVENYVNDGSNDYFESFVDESNTLDNFSYLSSFIRDSIKKNILEDEIDAFDTETLIGNETMKVGEVSYQITDKSLKKLLKGILKDIKSDVRATQIISLFQPNIIEYKIDDNKKYLNSNESYTINIYTSKPFYQPLKVEVVYLKNDQKGIYSFEGDFKEGIFYYSLNNELKYRGTIQSDKDHMNITVTDEYGKDAGSIKIEKDEENLSVLVTLALDEDKYDYSYQVKYRDYQENQYTREDEVHFKVLQDKVTQLQGDLVFHTDVMKDAKIDEDLSSSVLRSTLKDEEKEQLDHLRDKIKERLEK